MVDFSLKLMVPGFFLQILNVFKKGDVGIWVPNIAGAVGTQIKGVVEGCVDDAPMADH